MKNEKEKIYKISGGDGSEYIKITIYNELLEKMQKYVEQNELQFLDKTPIEIEVEDGGIEFPDLLCQPLPLFSERLKNILEKYEVDNIFYKPVYLVDNLLDEKHLYWLGVVDYIHCFEMDQEGKEQFLVERIGKYKIFRDYLQSGLAIYVTEDLKSILEQEEHNLEGIRYFQIENDK